MIYYVQTLMATFIEALCCKMFFETFFTKKNEEKSWRQKINFVILFVGFIVISLLQTQNYIWKAVSVIFLIGIISALQYKGKMLHLFFGAIVYYGLVLCIDRIVLTIVSFTINPYASDIFIDSIKTTVLTMLCKAVLFLCILFLNRIFKSQSNFYLIPGNEWMRFICFPMITIVCMTAFTLEGGKATKAVLISAFALVLSNFLIFYIIRDVIKNEKNIQEMKVSRERFKNQMEMYEYMEHVYDDQRKKMHDFKNHMGCVQGLLDTGDYKEAEKYLEKINKNWIEEMDYINTSNAIVNSVINQKFKLAKSKGIAMVLSISNLKDLTLSDEDTVIILSNLLDNAIEACEKVADKPREIKVRFTAEEEILISVRNPVAEPLNISDGKLLTTKADKESHGIGTSNITSAVHKYGGECIYSCNDGYFTYSVII